MSEISPARVKWGNRILWSGAVLLFLATAFWYLGIWTDDVRWNQTAATTVALAVVCEWIGVMVRWSTDD